MDARMDARMDGRTEGGRERHLALYCLVCISRMDGCTDGETLCSILESLPFCVNEWLHMFLFGHVWSGIAMYGHV